MLLLLLLAFGDPRTAFALRILAALSRLCPCAPTDGLCLALHRESAVGIAIVSGEQRDPEHAAALLVGALLHESCARTDRQAGGGPARSVYQLEVPAAQREAILADPILAARLALRAAMSCRESFRAYATGSCTIGSESQERTAADLRRSVMVATYALQ